MEPSPGHKQAIDLCKVNNMLVAACFVTRRAYVVCSKPRGQPTLILSFKNRFDAVLQPDNEQQHKANQKPFLILKAGWYHGCE
jgi:hypothetical protein